MSNIHSLIPDIYSIAGKVPLDITTRLRPKEPKGALRLSQLGPRCPRALWYSVHHPELEEERPPYAHIKFNYGHMIEDMAIAYMKAAGHRVEGEQDELTVDGITGHRDCIVDGCVVDVKSCSSLQFQKYKDRRVLEDDSFGYLDQLDAYLVGSLEDPLVLVKDKAYIFAVDKTLGHMVLYEHNLREASIRERIRAYKAIVDLREPPRCRCGTVADGTSGNIKLDTRASYSSFKHTCFPTLRTFLYESGPRYLTHVAKRPMRTDRKTPIPEVDRNGKFVYN